MQNASPNPVVAMQGSVVAAADSDDCDHCIRTSDPSPLAKSISEPVQRPSTRNKDRPWPVITLGIF